MAQQPDGIPRKTSRRQNGDGPVPGTRREAAAFRPSSPSPAAPPPEVMPSLDVLVAEFEQVVASNQQKFAELAARGAMPDPLELVHVRINSLIESIAQFAGPNGTRWAVMARLSFERQVAESLSQAEPAILRSQLAEGGRYTPGMIRQLAEQTGTVRRVH